MGSGCSADHRFVQERHEDEGSDYEEEEEEEEEATQASVGPQAKAQASVGPQAKAQDASNVRKDKPPVTAAPPQPAAPVPEPPKRPPEQPSKRPSLSETPDRSPTAAQSKASAQSSVSTPLPPSRTPAPPSTGTASAAPRRKSSGVDANDFHPPAEQVATQNSSNTTDLAALRTDERSPPATRAPQPDVWSDDLSTELPRLWQNKAIRTLALVHTSLRPLLLQPAVIFGALGDMRGERVPRAAQHFNLRAFMQAAPVILSFRLSHAHAQYLELMAQSQQTPAAAAPATADPAVSNVKKGASQITIGYGSKMSAPAMAMQLPGPPLFQQATTRAGQRTHAQKPSMQKVGAYATTLWMPSTLRKSNRRRQRSQFPFQREVVSVIASGQDAASCFVVHILPDILVNLQTFDTNVRPAVKAAFRAVHHKLYDTIVQRHEAQQTDVLESSSKGKFGAPVKEVDYSHLRAPRIDIALVYVRDDDLFACTTIGAPEPQLFCLQDIKGKQVISLESDSVGESVRSNDERSISSWGSSASINSSVRNGSTTRKAKEVKRTYDLPNLTTYYCPMTEVGVQDSMVTVGVTASTSQVRMATFSSALSGGADSVSPTVSQLSNNRTTWRPRFAIVLATDSFWHTLPTKEVWHLLYIMTELAVDAYTRRSVDKSAADLIRSYHNELMESTQKRLVAFYEERLEASLRDPPSMPEVAMAQVLCDVAEAKATIENTDNASRMSATVVSIS